MTDTPQLWFELEVDAVLDSRWVAWFEGLQVAYVNDRTLIYGPLPDQGALHGVLIKVRDLGLSLVSVRRIDPGPTRQEGTAHDQHPR